MELILSKSEYERLVEEVRALKSLIAALSAEKDDLELHICRQIQADYDQKIGNLEHSALAYKIEIMRLKRLIEYLQSAINLQKQMSYEEAEEKMEEDYHEYEEDLKQRAEKMRQDQEYAERRAKQDKENEARKEAEESAQRESGAVHAQTGEKQDTSDEAKISGDDPDGNVEENNHSNADSQEQAKIGKNQDTKDTEEDNPEKKMESPIEEMKRLYRKIVKKLHPDVNPDITPQEKELLDEAIKAYAEGNLERLREIAEQIDEADVADRFEDTEEGVAELKSLRDQLILQKEEIAVKIDRIKGSFPYTAKEFLADDEAVAARQKELNGLIQEYQKMIKTLNERIERLRKELEEAQNGGKEGTKQSDNQ